MHVDLICRTAVYVIRTHGGVGGGHREVFPYTDWASLRTNAPNDFWPFAIAGVLPLGQRFGRRHT